FLEPSLLVRVRLQRQIRFRLDLGLYYLGVVSQPFKFGLKALLSPPFCQTQNYLRIVQRYLRMVENFAMLHYSLLQRAPPENHCVLTQLRWPLRSNCCPAVQFDGGADAT